MRTLILIVLLTCGCDSFYRIELSVQASSGLPLKDVEVTADQYLKQKYMATLDLGTTDALGRLEYGRTATPELVFEFHKPGYASKRQAYLLGADEVAKYTVQMVEEVASTEQALPPAPVVGND